MQSRRAKSKLMLDRETIASLDLNRVVGAASSDSSDDGGTAGITRPGMPSCWTCFHTHCCRL